MRLSAPVALWAVVVPVSPASEVVCQLAIGTVPGWLIWCRIGVLAAVLAVGAFEQRARILVPFCAVYLFLLLLTAPLEVLASSGRYQAFMSREGFVRGTIVVHSIWLALLVPVVFWLRRRPDQFYFRIGDLTARLQPLGTVGTARLPRWSTIAPLFALVSAVVAWLFVSILGEATPKPWWAAPWALVFASVNSFGEELMNRNLLVGAVQLGFGARHAILVSATLFGIGHWDGLPAGPLGVAMTFVLGYVAAKALIDTRGMFWPWFMHVIPDCLLFYYWIIGSVAHGTLG